MRFVDKFSAILLDMNGTFMFGHDRFGPDQDYWATYCALGGRSMDRDRLLDLVQATCDGILRDYDLPERFEDFPSLIEAFSEYGSASESDLPILERLFAVHEMGYVPETHEEFLRQIAGSHHLGIVSNICARPEPWIAMFRKSGLLRLFKTLVFSSEGRFIKPSPQLFYRALAGLPPDATVLFVGDSLERDIIPAKALNLATAWVAPVGSQHPAADVVVTSLPDLATVAAAGVRQ